MKKVKEPLRLNLGVGQSPKEGFKGVDNVKTKNADYVVDLTKTPWPWKDGSVNATYSAHFLEHLDGPQRIKFMAELYRVLEDGGEAEFIVPYWTSMRSIQDPTHKWPPLCETSFLYFDEQWCRLNGLTHYGAGAKKVNFSFVYGHAIKPEWQAKNDETRTFATAHYVNVVEDLMVKLKKAPLLPPANGNK